MARLYRKRPLIVEAVEFTPDNLDEVEEFLQGVNYVVVDVGIILRGWHGDMFVQHGDYIVKGYNDEYYPVNPRAFLAGYMEYTGV